MRFVLHLIEIKKGGRCLITVIEYSRDFFREVSIEEIDKIDVVINKSKVTWIRISDLKDRETFGKLAEKFKIHPLTIEDILNVDQRPKIEEFQNYTYIVLKMFKFDKSSKELSSRQLNLILGDGLLISIEEEKSKVVDNVLEWVKASRGIVRSMDADYLLYLLMDVVIDGYFIVIEEIEDEIDVLEDELTSNPSPSLLHMIHKLKRQLLQFSKNMWPLREVVGTLERSGQRFVNPQTTPYFRDLYDHTIRVIESVETLQAILSDMLDVYFSAVSNKMNEVMKMLTMIATIFMPLSFIAGIYGMNFEYMPELKWVWGYPLTLSIMLLIGVTMILYFKRKKWI
ncbi:MAG: magnesium/cobalt transporter CorA [Nitrososphaerota archaeon]